MPPQFSKVILNPQVKILMAQLATALSLPPPPTEPPKMEAMMQISKEIERLSREKPKEMNMDVTEDPEDSD